MRAWEGMERFLQLSLGSQVGASGIAMIAVIELKQRVQQQARFQGPAGSNSVRLTTEEWRAVAGIHERKTFERAKTRLEELGVLHIVREGKLLEVTLWPAQIPMVESPTRDSEGEVVTSPRERENETKSGSASETDSVATNCVKGRRLRLLKGPNGRRAPIERSDEGTCLGTSCGTGYGTGYGTSAGTSSETGTVSLSKRVLMSKEDEVFFRPEVPENVDSPTFLDNNSLQRYPLNRSSLNRQDNNINNASNEVTNNDQRYNQRRDETIVVPSPEGASLLEFAIHWVQEVGHPLTSYEKEGLVRFLRLGYTEELLVEALRCAVAADNRRMGYVLGILRNWYQEGVRCLEDVVEVKKRWEDLRFLKRTDIS